MRDDHYPAGTVRFLLATDFVSPQTRAVLNDRLQTSKRITPPFFEEETFRLLEAAIKCLFPQSDKEEQIPLAILFEKELTQSKGKGWRYNDMPPMKEAMMQGLKAVNEEAQQLYQATLLQLSQAQKEALLTTIQKGEAHSPLWHGLPSALFFEEMLAMLAEIYYSHPLAKEEIGEAAFADNGGWQQLGLNNLEAREPRPLKSSSDETV